MVEKPDLSFIGLTELIYQVKRELVQQTEDSADPVPLLAVEEIELEITVSVTKKAEAGVNIQVVALGGGAERSDTHTVHVRLSPLLTREQRLAELRQDPRWSEMVQGQMMATIKGPGEQSQNDEY